MFCTAPVKLIFRQELCLTINNDCSLLQLKELDRLKGEVKDFARNRAKAGRKTLDLVFGLLLSLEFLKIRSESFNSEVWFFHRRRFMNVN